MNGVTAWVGSAACFALALVSIANGQEKPAVHRMEIYNGPFRTVHYFSPGASPAEQAKMREVERSENEAALADQLQALRRQYVTDESLLQARRREVQLLFYGHSNVIYGGIYGGAVAAYPYGYGSYTPYGYGYYAPGAYYGYSWYGDPYWPGFANVTAANGLFGVGDEGRIKAELARTLVPQPVGAPK